MLSLNIKDLQNKLQKSILRNIKSLGIDISTQKTGWALITTKSTKLYIKTGILNLKDKDIYIRYNKSIEYFNKLIKSDYIVVIENSFLGFNPQVFGKLSKIEGMIYAVCRLKKPFVNTKVMGASEARKNLGILGNCKKKDIQIWLKNTLDINIENEDIADAIVLAFNGIFQK